MRILNNSFNIIFFLGRPGSGKSELIDFIEKTPLNDRKNLLCISEHHTLDDFVYLWEKGKEDDILEELGRSRLYTSIDPTGYSIEDNFLYKLLLKKVDNAYLEKYSENDVFFENNTLFIEFSRGGENAYQDSFKLFSKELLEKAVVVYVKVSYEESCRKNKRRYNPDAKESILQHTLPDYIMEKYKIDDWENLTESKNNGLFEINGIKIPFYTFQNEPELTDDTEKIRPIALDCFETLKKLAEK